MGWPVQASCYVLGDKGKPTRHPGTAVSLYQKAAIISDGNVQTMIARFLYAGHGDLFGCIGTVPRASWIKPTNTDVFDLLDTKSGLASFGAYRSGVLSRNFDAPQLDLVNFELIRSLHELTSWKSRNGFRGVTTRERAVLGHYLDSNMMLLTGLLPYGYTCEEDERRWQGSSQPIPTSGWADVRVWTQPVHVEFGSESFWYPLRGSTLEDATHSYISLDLLASSGRPGPVPADFDLVFEGEVEIGYRRYSWTRIEGQLTLAQMDRDLSIDVAPARSLFPIGEPAQIGHQKKKKAT